MSMKIRWLGWAGAEVEEQGEHVVIDPLDDPSAVFAWLGERSVEVPLPEVVAPRAGAIAGLVTHLHRDHADASALRDALSNGSPVYEPLGYGGSANEELAISQADRELTDARLNRRAAVPWTSASAGPFTITALPAVDGTGDPQVSWLIEAGGKRVLHLGDTMFHGWWWRFAERFGAPDAVLAPINGARLTFPHRRPASTLAGAMDPEQAALAAQILRGDRLVPIHYGGYALSGIYEPVPDALARVNSAAERVSVMQPGDSIEV
jgi:L-ascorbate metabolism protein UlaG (beta-lactamase superfamily)